MAITTCTVSGNVKNLLGEAVTDCNVKVSVLTPFFHSGTFISGEIGSVTTDSNGDFSIDVVETESLGKKVTFTFDYSDGVSSRKTARYSVVVPNDATSQLADLVGIEAIAATFVTIPSSRVTIEPIAGMTATNVEEGFTEHEAEIDALDARLDTAEGEIDTLQANVVTAQAAADAAQADADAGIAAAAAAQTTANQGVTDAAGALAAANAAQTTADAAQTAADAAQDAADQAALDAATAASDAAAAASDAASASSDAAQAATDAASAVSAVTTAQTAADDAQADIDAHVADTANPHGVTAAQIGAVTTATYAAEKAAANGIATLGADGKLPSSQLGAIAVTDTYVVASQAAMLALSAAETGDVAVRTDLNKSFILKGTSYSTLADWQELLTPTDAVQSVNGSTGTVVLTTSNISEGTNEYYTQAKADARVAVHSGKTTGTGGDLHGITGALLGATQYATVTNKDLQFNSCFFTSPSNGYIMLQPSGSAGVQTVIQAPSTSARTHVLPDASGTLANLATAQTFTNKTFDTASNTFKATGATAGTVLMADGSGNTSWGVASGGGGVNFLASTDRDAESASHNWATYDDGTTASVPVDATGGTASLLTFNRTSTAGEVLAGTQSYKLAKATGNARGQGVSVPFTIDLGYRAKKTRVALLFKVLSGSLVEDDIKGFIIQDTSGTPTVVTPFEVQKLVGSQGQYIATFDPSISYGSYRFALHFATTSTTAVTFSFDVISVSDEQAAVGVAGSDPVSYTPSGAFTTNTTYSEGWIHREGKFLVIRGKATFSGAPNATTFYLDMPNSLRWEGLFELDVVGDWSLNRTGASRSEAGPIVAQAGLTARAGLFRVDDSGSSGANFTESVPSAIASGDILTWNIKVPIAGWSSNVTMGESSTFKISNYLASGTRVTTTPSKLGEYRAMYRASTSTNTLTDTAPTTGPSAANGMRIYASAYTVSGTAGNPSHYQVFVGKNKNVAIRLYAGTGYAYPVQHSLAAPISNVQYGTFAEYDPSTGVVTVDAAKDLSGSVTSRYLGRHNEATVSTTDGYFDITVSENALMVGVESNNVKVRYKRTSNQAIPATTTTILNFDVTDFESIPGTVTTGANWKFQPNRPGYYQVAVGGLTTGDVAVASSMETLVYKNGSSYQQIGFYRNSHTATSRAPIGGSPVLVYLNGTTDYVDVRVWCSNGTNIDASITHGIQIHRLPE